MGSWYNGRYRPSKGRKSSGLGGAFIDLFAVAIMTVIVSIISLFKRIK